MPGLQYDSPPPVSCGAGVAAGRRALVHDRMPPHRRACRSPSGLQRQQDGDRQGIVALDRSNGVRGSRPAISKARCDDISAARQPGKVGIARIDPVRMRLRHLAADGDRLGACALRCRRSHHDGARASGDEQHVEQLQRRRRCASS